MDIRNKNLVANVLYNFKKYILSKLETILAQYEIKTGITLKLELLPIF